MHIRKITQAYKEGYEAARMRFEYRNVYAKNSIASHDYNQGFHDGALLISQGNAPSQYANEVFHAVA